MPTRTESHSDLEARVQEIGRELWQRAGNEVPGIFNKGYWQGRMLDWAMRDPSFKIDLFRFVDVLPSLHNNDEVARHLREYLIKDGREVGMMMGAALKIAGGSLGFGSGIAANQIRKNVTEMAGRFIAGTNAAEALPVLRQLYRDGIAFTVDLLGEATLSDPEADAYQKRYLDLIDNLVEEVSAWPADNLIDRNHLGAIPRTNVSIKVSAMEPHLDPADARGSVKRLMKRVLPLFLRAKERGVFLNVDLEQWSLHQITYDLFDELLSHPDLKSWPHVGMVVQAYLKSAHDDLHRLIDLAKQRGAPLTVRLVKGAYWDYEVVNSAQNGYPCPVFIDKSQTDANYESLTRLMLENPDWILLAFGSHNLRSLSHALAVSQELNVPIGAIEIQMLYGMAEPERAALRQMGHRVRLYTPVGEMLPGMAYLVRRLLENTANSGFLKISHHDGVDVNQLLSPPATVITQKPRDHERISRLKTGELRSPFDNCPLADFTATNVTKTFAEAIEQVGQSLPRIVPVVVNGRVQDGRRVLERECPSDTKMIVARVSYATRQDADEAVRVALSAFPEWRDRPLIERAVLLEKLADRLQADRYELAALQTFEVGKPWRDADADVAEAVDYCRYYARQSLIELSPRKQGVAPGENNVLMYEGRGPTAVIAPWNFPLAILCGMATAALVAGNPVILKPAEQSTAVGHELYKRMIESGFDSGVVQFLPGDGAEVGAALVEHPQIAQIAFTGSKQVGLHILEQAAKVRPGQIMLKRVVCEMGGKNAIIVDEDADLDEAVAGVMRSAFGYAGQKCSACSRAIIVGTAYGPFVARLIDACRCLHIAPAYDPACQMGPVIDRESFERLGQIIAEPGTGAKPLYIGAAPSGGHYIGPALYEIVDMNHRLMCEELFGPVIALATADTFETAIARANDSAYKLTGAVFSRSPVNLELARRSFRVGNLYLNRGSTGAMIDRQPFGGFGMSGGGAKAGGPGYLLQFVDARVVTENTMRRGMTPELTE